MTRKSKDDWLNESLHILAEVGAGAFTIDLLTSRLGVTKGSFYHHFGSFAAFKSELLAHCEAIGTQAVIDYTLGGENPLEKMDRMLEVAGLDVRLEIALRAWALQDEEVRAYQAGVDARRLAFLQELCAAFSPEDAPTMARMLYTMFVGAQQIIPPLNGKPLADLFHTFKKLYGLDGSRET